MYDGEVDVDSQESVRIADQHISYVAMGLQTVPQLPTGVSANLIQRLCLHGNQICSLDGIGGFSALRELVLSSNALSSLGTELAGLQQLRALDVTSNCLTAADGLKGLTSLRRLVGIALIEALSI